MDFSYQKLSKEHLPLVDAFSCVESDEQLKSYKSSERRRIKKHSKEMEDFLKLEAFDEQELGMNATHLLIDENNNKIVAYISLCNDAIRLELDESKQEGIAYQTAPALKIARLAVSNEYQHMGIGRQLISFAAYIAQKIQNESGIIFITLDCYAHRISFYEQVGFLKNKIQPIQLEYDSPYSMRLGLLKYLEKIAETIN
ncbi:MAG: GNAT family N-acetyltransferase [Oscillospiraceae bacterium]|nr:GNAT family N-acetyltransferase [Oscillospiraceae bacterium]